MVIHRGNYKMRINTWRAGQLIVEEQIFHRFDLAMNAAQRSAAESVKLYEQETGLLIWAGYPGDLVGYAIGG
jgi:hypothetical protein